MADGPPLARSPSPSASFYAMSDDEESDYNTVAHTRSGRGVKLLFSKSKVYVHPTPSAKDNIPGYIALLQQKPADGARPTSSSSASSKKPAAPDLLLAWVPESSLGDAASVYVKVDLCEGDSPPKQSYLVPPPPTVTTHSDLVGNYAFAIPVSAVFSLLVRPPSVGWWYGSVIINSRAGDSFPALFFHDGECESTILQKRKRARETFDPFGEDGEMFWGGDEVLRWLKKYVPVEKATGEPNVYLIDPSTEDREGFAWKTPSSPSNIGRKDSVSGIRGGTATGAAFPGLEPSSSNDAKMDPFMKFVKETGWNIMERFSRVTTLTRRAAQDILESPNTPPQVKRLLRNPEVQTLQEEFDSARLYLARWAMGMAEQSDRDRRRRIWTAQDVMELEDTDVGEFELVEGSSALSLDERRKAVTLEEWKGYFDPVTGRLTLTIDEVKERIFHGGLDPDDGVRNEAWLFLLGVHAWYSTEDERRAQVASLRDEYHRLKLSWWERLDGLGGEGEVGDSWREQRARIEKDVHRTDRNVPLFAGEDVPHPDPKSPFAEVGTNAHLEQLKEMLLTYNEYNTDLGYVQGMSDLLAPIYAVIQDDAIAFWAFQRFMERMERNFLRDQSGMRAQLLTIDQLVQFMDPKLHAHLQATESTNFFFFFRMLLVWYKREFEWMDILHLWEVLWTDYLTSGFHLFIALAILERHRDIIMRHLKAFDEVLKYINDLSNTMDLDATLIRAEQLFRRFRRLVDAADKKDTLPRPRLEKPAQKPGEPVAYPRPVAGSSAAAAAAPGGAVSPSRVAAGRASEVGSVERVITPELRRLLSRNVDIVARKKPVSKASSVVKPASGEARSVPKLASKTSSVAKPASDGVSSAVASEGISGVVNPASEEASSVVNPASEETSSVVKPASEEVSNVAGG